MALIGLSLGATLWLIFFGILHHFSSTRIQVHARLQVLTGESAIKKQQKDRSRPTRHGIRIPKLTARIENALRKADVQVPVREFIVRWMAVTVCLVIAGYLLAGFGGSFICFFGTCMSTGLYLRVRGEQRIRRFNDGLQDMLTVISNSMRSGHSFAQAVHIVCEDLHGPVQAELQKIEQETQVGLSMEEALDRASERIGSEDFDLIVTAIGIQRQVGGNLSDVLDKISGTIRDRVRLQREVKALTAQGRISALIFMLMPAAIGCILYLMNPSYMGVMIHSLPGILMLVLAGIGQIIGFFFIRKIIHITM